ncbi:hypothetical protein BDV95DRAFT_576087 [Massariosphaeria phaeospora]|uniref:SET domain-containing protein n=1 Tax=Massariosphaeria phaeospora TaxID=100035 RepID=A0A7C8I5C7_9PLEO|nr:hypothetical protein BDV95DRAFT_576087 [Massariosphaeria phaeospora]
MPAMVVIPTGRPTRRVRLDKVHSIVCNRVKDGDEQFLVRWKSSTSTGKPPLSWHAVNELTRCLELVQEYLETRHKIPAFQQSKKRKSPDTDIEIERRASPLDRRLNLSSRTPSISRSPSVSSTASSAVIDVYNGVLDSEEGFLLCRPASGPEIPEINITAVPTVDMAHAARRARVDTASILIRAEYTRRLEKVPGSKIHLINTYDSTTPSLRFRYITDYILREGVFKIDQAAQVGCKQCSPHMGRDIGCEYTKKCDCLEYAAVDENRITDPDMRDAYNHALATGGSTIGFPKKFPYFAEGAKRERAGCLVPFYLNSRRPIYECNDNCNCGPHCRNKNVQLGRTVELEIFKVRDGRGWGLRCHHKLYEGQFIDTYRGEIITDAEATRREQASSSKAKASYLYSLDKFAESEGLEPEDVYVVDGEFMGGPTKFINHCCEPNCRQYTVSYNKHDCRVYDIAFFACRDIEAGEELTFDYLDKEESEGVDEEPGEGAIPCLCGAAKCRKWLWT